MLVLVRRVKKTGIICLSLLVVLVIYLASAERIAMKLTGADQNITETKKLPAQATAKLYYSIDVDEPTDGLTLQFYLEGWAFLMNQSGEKDAMVNETHSFPRKIDVMLVSQEVSYVIPVQLQARPDIRRVHGEIMQGLSKTDDFGFTCSFSPLPIRNGIYELAFAIRENEALKGLALSGIRYQMSGKGLRRVIQ